MRVKVGAKRDGTLTTMEMKLLVDSGAYVAQAGGVARVGAFNAATLYRVENARVHSRTFYTNNPYASAFRGYGNTQGTFALFESAIDDLLTRLDIDPVQFRIKNGNRNGLPTHSRPAHPQLRLRGVPRRGRQGGALGRTRGKRFHNGSKVRGLSVATVINVGGGARDQGDSDASGAVLQMRETAPSRSTRAGRRSARAATRSSRRSPPRSWACRSTESSCSTSTPT